MSDADLNPPTLTQEQGQEGSPSDGASSPEPTTTPAFQTSPATVKRRQRHLLERLRRSVSRQPHDIGEGMDKVVFGVAATATIAFVVWGFVDPHGLGRVVATGRTLSDPMRGAEPSGVRHRGRSGRCCTFDRDPPPEDPRNHAETSRNSTLMKSSHVQSGSLCTWEPMH